MLIRMICYRNVTLLGQRLRLTALTRKLCSSLESKKPDANEKIKREEKHDQSLESQKPDANEQRKREEKHDQFVKRQMVSTGRVFENEQNKDKANYLDIINIYLDKEKLRRNHVEFIYAALKNMEEYGVHKNLKVYKALIDVMPKGKFIPQNIFQAEFQHYPKQQQCIIDLLEQMEDNGRFRLTA